MKKLIMALVLMPLMTLADTEIVNGIEWTFEISGGEATVGPGSWPNSAISGDTVGAIEIPSTLGGCPVVSINNYAFFDCSGLTTVTIPSSVTSIGDSAFYGCSGLTTVTIPSSVTSIGDSAFYGCRGLKSVTIPSGVASIGNDAFQDCRELTSVTIPSDVTSIGDCAFRGCSGLKSILVNEENASYSSVDGVLYDKTKTELLCCPGGMVGDVTIPEGVTSIEYEAFYGCSGLTTVTIPSSVTSIGALVFYRCSRLTSISVSEGNASYSSVDGVLYDKAKTGLVCCPAGKVGDVAIPEGVTSIGDLVFSDCSGLTTVTIPSSVTSIGYDAFYWCYGLTSVTIPEGVSSIGNRAFEFCLGLESVTIPSSVTSIGDYAFGGCSRLKTVRVVAGDAERVKAMIADSGSGIEVGSLTFVEMLEDGGPYTETVDGIEWTFEIFDGEARVGDYDYQAIPDDTVGAIEIPSMLGGCPVTSIGEHAFSGCSGLTSVTIPSSVTSIEDYAFGGCSGLTSVTIPSSVTSIGEHAFSGCSGLTSVTIPSSVTSIGYGAFSGCSGLTSVTIPSSVTSIGGAVFYSCRGLRSVMIPEGVTSIEGQAFEWCSGLTSVTIPSSVTSIGNGAFSDCSGLTSISVSEENASYSSVDGVLYDKEKTELVCFPAGKVGDMTIPEGVMSIGNLSFYDCYGLKSVTIPSSVTSIGMQAFLGCNGLTSVMIPEGVTSIGDQAFSDCSGLTTISVSEGNASYSSVDGVLYDKEKTELVRCPAGKVGDMTIPEGVTSIGEDAFAHCSGLKSVTIPPSVTSIGDWVFYCCSGLESVTIPSGVTSIGDYAFNGCSGLKTVRVSAGDAERVKAMIADSYSGIDVDSLTFVEQFPDGGPYVETVDGIGWTFMIENGMAKVGGGEGGAAISREMLGAVIVPPTLGGCSVVSVGDHAFEGCKGLSSITIPDSVEVIGESAFENCRHLESITIPATVKKIDAYAFYGCGLLKTVNYLGEKPEIESAAFMGTGVEQPPAADVVNVVVSNIIVQYVFNSVQPQFAIPATSDTGFVNIITEVKGNNVAIPATWASEYPNFVSKYGSDFTKALTMKTGKKDGAGNEMIVWQDYVAGTDPTDEKDVFRASITIVDGKVTISYTPELDDARKAMRKYTTWGKTSLMDTDWTEVQEGRESEYNFFKVSVEMK